MSDWSALARALQEEYRGRLSTQGVTFQVAEYRRAHGGLAVETVPNEAWTDLRRRLDEMSRQLGHSVIRLREPEQVGS